MRVGDKWFHPLLYWACDYLSILEFNLIHVSKRAPGIDVSVDRVLAEVFVILSDRSTSPIMLYNYCDVIMGAIASQITSLKIVYSILYSSADQRKHQSSASLAFVRGSHRGPVNSPHKWPVTRKMFPIDDVNMTLQICKDVNWMEWYATHPLNRNDIGTNTSTTKMYVVEWCSGTRHGYIITYI